MRKFIIALCFCIGALHTHNVMANGENNGPKCNNRSCNETTNNNQTYNNPSAHAKASLKARLSSNSRASARSSSYQSQDQGQYQSNTGIQKGFGSGNATDVSITSNYEASAVPPSLGQGDPGYDCAMTGGVGAAVPGFGGSIQWSDASINCELGMLYRLGKDDPDVRDRALDAYDVLYSRILTQASGDDSTKRDPSVREGR